MEKRLSAFWLFLSIFCIPASIFVATASAYAEPTLLLFKARVVVDRSGWTEYVYIRARDSIAARKILEAQFGKGKVRDVVREYGQ